MYIRKLALCLFNVTKYVTHFSSSNITYNNALVDSAYLVENIFSDRVTRLSALKPPSCLQNGIFFNLLRRISSEGLFRVTRYELKNGRPHKASYSLLEPGPGSELFPLCQIKGRRTCLFLIECISNTKRKPRMNRGGSISEKL